MNREIGEVGEVEVDEVDFDDDDDRRRGKLSLRLLLRNHLEDLEFL